MVMIIDDDYDDDDDDDENDYNGYNNDGDYHFLSCFFILHNDKLF